MFDDTKGEGPSDGGRGGYPPPSMDTPTGGVTVHEKEDLFDFYW